MMGDFVDGKIHGLRALYTNNGDYELCLHDGVGIGICKSADEVNFKKIEKFIWKLIVYGIINSKKI